MWRRLRSSFFYENQQMCSSSYRTILSLIHPAGKRSSRIENPQMGHTAVATILSAIGENEHETFASGQRLDTARCSFGRQPERGQRLCQGIGRNRGAPRDVQRTEPASAAANISGREPKHGALPIKDTVRAVNSLRYFYAGSDTALERPTGFSLRCCVR